MPSHTNREFHHVMSYNNFGLLNIEGPNSLTIVVILQEETTPFKPFTHRYYVPYASSHSTSPLWYSIKRASAYIIVLSYYSAYGKNITPPMNEMLELNISKIVLLLHGFNVKQAII